MCFSAQTGVEYIASACISLKVSGTLIRFPTLDLLIIIIIIFLLYMIKYLNHSICIWCSAFTWGLGPFFLETLLMAVFFICTYVFCH